MNILDQIYECKDDKELKELANEAIEAYTNKAKEENNELDYLGEDLSYNPTIKSMDIDHSHANNLWIGYIPKGMKLVYGRFREDSNKPFTNRGKYYYIDDDSYIYEFFKYIKEEQPEIEDEFDMMVYVSEFLEEMFSKNINPMEREQINKMIYKDNFLFHDRVREHSIKDLYGNGSALCTEYALVGQNILSVLGFDMVYAMDLNHAYNIYIPNPSIEEDQMEDVAYIVDFSNWIPCLDYNFELKTTSPFFGKIDCKKEDLEAFFKGKIKLKFKDYFLYSINGNIIEMEYNNKERMYGVDYNFEEEKKILTKSRHK